ncbi:MAG: hypothetical protein V1900_02625 [Candidatus Aenigmatarchaeota archaeon]
MANEFVIFLIIGLVAIAAMMAISVIPQTETREITTQPTIEEKNLTGALLVGPKDFDVNRPYSLDFDVGNMRVNKTHNVGDKEVYNGLLFGSSSIKYNIKADKPVRLTLNFMVARTNNYESLVIKITDNVIESKSILQGEYEISVPKELLADDMVLEIFTLSSGWKIWAPSLYDLRNVEITVDSFSEKMNSLSFDIIDEYQTFKSGRVDFGIAEARGTFIAELNGKNIYSGEIDSVKFGKSDIKFGPNVLVLRAGNYSKFSGKAVVTIVYTTRTDEKVEKNFTVTKDTYDSLKNGKIKFDVVNITRTGGVSAKIVFGDKVLFNEYQKLGESGYSFPFGKSNVAVGVNSVIIESVDDSVFAIKNLEITY